MMKNDVQYEYKEGTILGEEHFYSNGDALSDIILTALLESLS